MCSISVHFYKSFVFWLTLLAPKNTLRLVTYSNKYYKLESICKIYDTCELLVKNGKNVDFIKSITTIKNCDKYDYKNKLLLEII